MENEKLLAIQECCMHYHIEVSFIESLNEAGLIEVVTVNEMDYIPVENIGHLEKLVRIHHELNINTEGIEAIAHLLNRVDRLQEEIMVLRNRLRLYED